MIKRYDFFREKIEKEVFVARECLNLNKIGAAEGALYKASKRLDVFYEQTIGHYRNIPRWIFVGLLVSIPLFFIPAVIFTIPACVSYGVGNADKWFNIDYESRIQQLRTMIAEMRDELPIK